MARPSDIETRVAILARIVSRMPGDAFFYRRSDRCSYKRLTAMSYFLQEVEGVATGYDFRIFNYGPVDSEIGSTVLVAARPRPNVLVIENGDMLSLGSDGNIAAGSLDPGLQMRVDQLVAKVSRAVKGMFDRSVVHASDYEIDDMLAAMSMVAFVDQEFARKGQDVADEVIATRTGSVMPGVSVARALYCISRLRGEGLVRDESSQERRTGAVVGDSTLAPRRKDECPKCRRPCAWRMGIPFEHQMLCGYCWLAFEPESLWEEEEAERAFYNTSGD